MSGTTRLGHRRVELALHELRAGEGRALLLLHGLGERTPAAVPGWLAPWPGPVFGLDFTGHGASTLPTGGGYTAEVLLGDADAAVTALGDPTILGRGVGAYVALLVAGARASDLRGAVLADGPGLAGGGPRPGSLAVAVAPTAPVRTPDPLALAELASDVRPPDYAATFARLAFESSPLDMPISVVSRARPDWLRAVVDEPGVVEESLDAALVRYSKLS